MKTVAARKKKRPVPTDEKLRVIAAFLWLDGLPIMEIGRRLNLKPNQVRAYLREAQDAGDIQPLDHYAQVRKDRRRTQLDAKIFSLAPTAIKRIADILRLPVDPAQPGSLRVIQQTAQWVLDRALPRLVDPEADVPASIKTIILQRIERIPELVDVTPRLPSGEGEER